MKIKVAPSILSADFGRLAEEIEAVERAGADWIHVDVMDGRFVPNITVGPLVVEAARRATSLPLDVHLMIADPDRYLADFASAGADLITVHSEACIHLHRTLQAIRDLGKKAGVCFNPATPVEPIGHVLELLDLVLIMSVNPGFSGQKFIEGSLPKLKEARELVGKTSRAVEISVDGGVSGSNSRSIREAGATVLVAGNAVFGSGDYRAAIEGIRKGQKKP